MSVGFYVARYKPIRKELQKYLSQEVVEDLTSGLLLELDNLPDHYMVRDGEDLDDHLKELGEDWQRQHSQVVAFAKKLTKHYAGDEVAVCW